MNEFRVESLEDTFNRKYVSSQYSWCETREVRREISGFRRSHCFRRDFTGGFVVRIENVRKY